VNPPPLVQHVQGNVVEQEKEAWPRLPACWKNGFTRAVADPQVMRSTSLSFATPESFLGRWQKNVRRSRTRRSDLVRTD